MSIQSRVQPDARSTSLFRLLREAERLLAAGRIAEAMNAATGALAIDPDHLPALTCFARAQIKGGRFSEAIATLAGALSRWPGDAALLGELAQAQASVGALDDAIATLRTRVAAKPDGASWFDLALMLDRNAECAEALDAARRAEALAPRHHAARFLAARALTGLGRIDEAAVEYRALARNEPGEAARAWFGLADLKTASFHDDDIDAMRKLARDPRGGEEQRMLAGFAAGHACEVQGHLVEAMEHFQQANRLRHKTIRWDTVTHRKYCESVRQAFSTSLPEAPPMLGEQVIFIVGMPRSGTTLVEQLLAAHPDVVAASELPHLETVIQEESSRRNQPFPRWVGTADATDWERLGRRYLQLTERWQGGRRFTDKLPENLPYVGAALAMLPGARVIGCERDLLETCWSCYKQLFAPHRVAYSYDFDDLASYARDSRDLWSWWRQREPLRCHSLIHEDLLAHPEREIRQLLAFCRLDFNSACLTPQSAARVTRTASAAQIRQPLQRDTARRPRYRDLLASLEAALAGAGLTDTR